VRRLQSISYDTMFYLPGGPVAAIVLGAVLFPFRTYTNAANFSFLFLALIIVVAELGGRAAAIATAAVSALSLDFFLTTPYLSLRIYGWSDLLAFLGLVLCGLIAAEMGARSRGRLRALRTARARLDLLHAALAEAGAPPDPAVIETLLRTAREETPISGAVLRNAAGTVVAAVPGEHATRPSPAVTMPADRLPAGALEDSAGSGAPLPASGVRLPLLRDGRQVGWLDLWGDGEPAGVEARRILSDLGHALAWHLAG
jgi:K+-sensing histidine kinase KdpD